MTIIECFEKAPIENMISTLAARPDKLVFIGDESQMTKSLTVYKRFLSEYGYKKTKVLSKGIDKNNLNDIVSVLTEIVTTEDECIGIHGISQRKKQYDDISKIWKCKISIS